MTTIEDIARLLSADIVERVVVVGEGDSATLMLMPAPLWQPIYLATVVGDQVCRVQQGHAYKVLAELSAGPAAVAETLAEWIRWLAVPRDEQLGELIYQAHAHGQAKAPGHRPAGHGYGARDLHAGLISRDKVDARRLRRELEALIGADQGTMQ